MNNLNSKAVIFEWTDADKLYQTKIYKSQTRLKLIEISENKKKELIVTAFSASDKQQAWIEHDNVSCPRFIIRLRIVETRFTIRFVRIRDSPRRINFVRSSSVGQCFLHWMDQRDWYTAFWKACSAVESSTVQWPLIGIGFLRLPRSLWLLVW